MRPTRGDWRRRLACIARFLGRSLVQDGREPARRSQNWMLCDTTTPGVAAVCSLWVKLIAAGILLSG